MTTKTVAVKKEDLQAIVEALAWFISNDETNRGDVPIPELGGRTWDEMNAYWIDGLERGEKALVMAVQYLEDSHDQR